MPFPSYTSSVVEVNTEDALQPSRFAGSVGGRLVVGPKDRRIDVLWPGLSTGPAANATTKAYWLATENPDDKPAGSTPESSTLESWRVDKSILLT